MQKITFNGCYIYHVIGTLSMKHIMASLLSLARQPKFRWKTFILYNGSDMPSEDIMAIFTLLHLDKRFEKIGEYPYDDSTPKSAVADWDVQMKNIGDHTYYLCHKADFYLSDRSILEFEKYVSRYPKPFLINFKKLNFQEGNLDYERYASMNYERFSKDSTVSFNPQDTHGITGMTDDHPIWDGIMHGYSDDARPLYQPTEEEIMSPAGGNTILIRMGKSGVNLHRENNIFALHMYHKIPQRSN